MTLQRIFAPLFLAAVILLPPSPTAAQVPEPAAGWPGPAHLFLHRPYRDYTANYVYNLLFGDNLELLRRDHGRERDEAWTAVLAPDPDSAALRGIAANATGESQLRLLAYNRLRARGATVPRRVLLGVVVENHQESGLDVLAAFPDGRVRYIHYTGNMSTFEGAPPEVAEKARALLTASKSVVGQIGPWPAARLPPPRRDRVRITFLVSDGLYFGEGTFEELEGDPRGRAVIQAATALLQAVVAAPREERGFRVLEP